MSDATPETPAPDADSSATPPAPAPLRLPIVRGEDGQYHLVNGTGERQPWTEEPSHRGPGIEVSAATAALREGIASGPLSSALHGMLEGNLNARDLAFAELATLGGVSGLMLDQPNLGWSPGVPSPVAHHDPPAARAPDLFADLAAAHVTGSARRRIVEWLRCAAERRTWAEIAGASYHVPDDSDPRYRTYRQLNGRGGFRHVLEAVREYRDARKVGGGERYETEPLVAPVEDDDPRDGPASELAGAVLRDEKRLPLTVAKLLALISGMMTRPVAKSGPAATAAILSAPLPSPTEEGLTLKQVARALGVPYETVRSARRRNSAGSALGRLNDSDARIGRRWRPSVVAEIGAARATAKTTTEKASDANEARLSREIAEAKAANRRATLDRR